MENRDKFLQASAYNILSTYQYVISFNVYLFRDTLFNIYCWFIKIELMAKSIAPDWTKLI